MNIIIAGSTGMIGKLVLRNCLAYESVDKVICLVRTPTNDYKHEKLKEIIIDNFENYSEYKDYFKNIDVAFFCIGVYTGQVSDNEFKKITVNYAVEFARALQKNSPQATLCLLSGAGADRTEKSKTSFARYKGMAENQIFNSGLKAYSFRPAYIYPVEARKEPNFAYRVMKVFYPLLKAFGLSVRSTDLAKAMFNVGLHGATKNVLENKDILEHI